MTAESQNIEFKQSWHDDYLKWVCGFANAAGGRIQIGKDDAGAVVGLGNAKRLLQDLPNKIRDQLGLMPPIHLHEEAGRSWIEIVVEPASVPISLRGAYYWRSGSVKQELKGAALNEFLLKKMGLSWDRAVEADASLDDIDVSTIERFKKEAQTAGRLPDLSGLSTADLLKKLRLLTRKGLTHAALVLFGKDPGEFYPNLSVKIGRFGATVVDMRFQEVCEGNLFQMMRDVMEQLEKKFLIKPVRFEGLRRIEELEYPVPALREMLLNALVHRDYMGSMTQLKVMDDRISLWNAGLLPAELPVDKLFEVHGSIPRNPLIAEVCYKAGYIDSWGRGVEKIAEACQNSGLPKPQIIEHTGGVAVELTHRGKAGLGDELGKDEARLRNDFGTISERIRKEFGAETAKAFEFICQHPEYTAEQIASEVNKTSRTIENYIAKLKTSGFIVRRGPNLGGYWEIKEPS